MWRVGNAAFIAAWLRRKHARRRARAGRAIETIRAHRGHIAGVGRSRARSSLGVMDKLFIRPVALAALALALAVAGLLPARADARIVVNRGVDPARIGM